MNKTKKEKLELPNNKKLELAIELARESFHLALEVIESTNPPDSAPLRAGTIKIDSGWQLLEYVLNLRLENGID